MQIVITGHTSGIGKGLYDFYRDRGHTVVGFSRSNGYDLSTEEAINKVAANVVKNCDVFFNNAYADMAQVKLMYKIHPFWESQPDKKHVVIGSRASDFLHNKPQYYAVAKGAVDNAVEQLRPLSKYHLINIKPSWVKTPMLPTRFTENDPTISVDSLVGFIDYIVTNKSMRIVNVTIDTITK